MIEPCLATDELAAMIAGDLAPERVEAVLVHVDRCAVCAEVMASLGGLGAAPGDVGRYQLGRVLGSGAMGIVYDAWDPQLRRRVALKLVRPERSDAESHDRMLREARALARIVQISGSNTWNGVSSGAIVAARVAEATAGSDNAPTLAQPTMTVSKAHATIPY
jgi:hypothetical protein